MKSLILALLLLSVPLTAQTVQTGDGKISIVDIGQLPTSNYSSLPSCTSAKDGKSFRVTDANRDVYTCHGSSGKWVSRNGGIYNIGDFGAAGDGISDDTVAIQAALDAAGTAGGGRVVAVAGKTYLVSRNTSLQYQFGSITIVPALGVPSNVTFDLNTSTFKLAATGGLRASMICNKSGATNIEITNGFLDSATQTATTSGHEVSLIGLFNTSQTRVTRIVAKAGIDYAGRFLGVTDGYWDALLCLTSEADAWSFGISSNGGSDFRIIRSHIGRVEAHDVGSNLGNHGTLQGNPVIITAKNTTFESIVTENAAGGTKIQDESERVIIGSIVYVGGTFSTANSGIKIQGNGAGLVPTDITLNSAISRNCYSEGLKIVNAANVSVGRYTGFNNGTNAPQRDVSVQNSTATISSITSTSPTVMALSVSGTGVNLSVGDVSVVAGSGTVSAVQITSTAGVVRIGTIRGTDSQGSPTLAYLLDVEDSAATGSVRNVISDWTPTSSRPILKSTTSILLDIDEVTVAGYQTTGITTLSAGNSTNVPTPSVFRVYSGGTSYIQPVITLTPLNTAAGNLPTLLAVTSGDLNATGFTISHSNASGSEIVAWKISRWRVGSVPSLSFIGSMLLPYTAKTSTYSATNSDVTIDCTSGSFTVTLPTAVGVTGKVYVIKNSGAGTITLATTGGQTIDGASPGTLSPNSSIMVQSDGANWKIASANGANLNLNNLNATGVNVDLNPGTAGSQALGSTSAPWHYLFFSGSSGTPTSNAFKLTGASTGGLRTQTFPDNSGTVANLNLAQTWSAQQTFSTTTTFSGLTASTVPYLDASKNLTSSAVTPTELGYVSGVTSAIQAQLNAKAALVSPAFTTPDIGAATGTSLTLTGGNLALATAGKSVQVKTGANACAGVATLSTGTVTVSTTCVGATYGTDYMIVLTPKGSSTGVVRVSTVTANTSFVITSSDGASSDNVSWFVVKLN